MGRRLALGSSQRRVTWNTRSRTPGTRFPSIAPLVCPAGRPTFFHSGSDGTPAHPLYAHSLVSGVAGSSKRSISYQSAKREARWCASTSFHAQKVVPVWFQE